MSDAVVPLRGLVAATGMSLNRTARFLGVDDRAMRRWTHGGGEAPRSVVMLLAIMDHHGIAPDDVLSILDAYGYTA